MKRVLAFGVLPLAIGLLWGVAMRWPVPPEPLPERFRGIYRLYRFEPPPGVTMGNPYPEGQRWFYTLRADGSYRITVRILNDFEMLRIEGMARIGEADSLTLEQVSQNRTKDPAPPVRYGTQWDRDEQGAEVLVLTEVANGSQLYLRRTDAIQ